MAQITSVKWWRVFLTSHSCEEKQAENHSRVRLIVRKEEVEGSHHTAHCSKTFFQQGEFVTGCHYLSLATSCLSSWICSYLQWVGAKCPWSVALGFWEAAELWIMGVRQDRRASKQHESGIQHSQSPGQICSQKQAYKQRYMQSDICNAEGLHWHRKICKVNSKVSIWGLQSKHHEWTWIKENTFSNTESSLMFPFGEAPP